MVQNRAQLNKVKGKSLILPQIYKTKGFKNGPMGPSTSEHVSLQMIPRKQLKLIIIIMKR
jgi:hypothetical protein